GSLATCACRGVVESSAARGRPTTSPTRRSSELRAHGNIAAILAATPAVMLTHDSRTLELARHHGIPSLVRGTDPDPTSVQELYSHADFTEFNVRQAVRFEYLTRVIRGNRSEHSSAT